MRKILGISLALVVALTTMASGKPVSKDSDFLPEADQPSLESLSSGTSSLSTHIYGDTVGYGGTYWASDSLRWEAVRDSHWSFDSGVGSSINDGTNPNKPIGYHQQMEGWYGIDVTLNPLPYFRRSSNCVLGGTFSLWAGVTLAEANGLCYAGGQGYGNAWSLIVSKSFAYSGAGNVSFSFLYAHDLELGFDFVYAYIDTSGDSSVDDVELFNGTGIDSATAAVTLNPGQDMRSDAGAYVIKFAIVADGAYSDEDGLWDSFCGAFVVDNIQVGADFTDFESGPNGWAQENPTEGVGDFSNIADLGDLEPPPVFCPCSISDSVLVFNNEVGLHPLDQDNLAASPVADLRAGGDAGRPGKLIIFDDYRFLPIANYVFLQFSARYYPEICQATGLLITTGWKTSSTVNFAPVPFCTGPASGPRIRNFSAFIQPSAEQVQIAIGVLNLCRTQPFTPTECTGTNNESPYVDNVSIGVFGNSTRPVVQTTTFDRFQDNFAADGSLNPASPGRIDVNRLKGVSSPTTGTVLGDTLVARGDGGNVEVRLVFKFRKGPFVSNATLAAYTSRWTFEPNLNGSYGTDANPATFPNWYSVRMDTAQQGMATTNGSWMTTFHENDPGFMGSDLALDPNDSGHLANDIIPDHLFTPGSRMDYFVASRFGTGGFPGVTISDPRNPGGLAWATDPDTTGGIFREAEILPSSMDADTTWNCVLYVDHHDDRDGFDQLLEETGLTLSLGTGSANAEGTRYDRFDDQTPSSGQMSFGRPLSTAYGASQLQVFAYKAIGWHGGSLNTGIVTNEDAAILNPWLVLRAVGNNNFWGSGEGIMESMNLTGGLAKSFMNNTLGVTANCVSIRSAACGGAAIDTTFCIPTSAASSPHFASTIQPRGRGNGCPTLLNFDVLTANPAVVTAKGQMNYVRLVPGQGGTPTDINYASVTNFNTADVTFKTVLDGISVGRMRSNAGFFGVGCDEVNASYERTDNVHDWFGATSICRIPQNLVDVPVFGGPQPPAFRHALGNAYPNPMNPTTRIQFTNGVANGRVKVEIFDVTGRLVRSLVDAKLPVGVHEVTWDGASEGGSTVPSGMYFYRMTADDFVSAKKLVVSK